MKPTSSRVRLLPAASQPEIRFLFTTDGISRRQMAPPMLLVAFGLALIVSYASAHHAHGATVDHNQPAVVGGR